MATAATASKDCSRRRDATGSAAAVLDTELKCVSSYCVGPYLVLWRHPYSQGRPLDGAWPQYQSRRATILGAENRFAYSRMPSMRSLLQMCEESLTIS